jgi:hypothetical protein
MLHLRGIEQQDEPTQQQYRATGTAEGSEGSEGSVMSKRALANVIAFPEN